MTFSDGHLFEPRETLPSRYQQIKSIYQKLGVFSGAEIDSILTVSTDLPASASDLLVGSNPNANVTEFAVMMSFRVPLSDTVPGVTGCRDRFLTLARDYPCAFKAVCAANLMWFTYMFDAIVNSANTHALKTAGSALVSSTATTFPYDRSRDRFIATKEFVTRMKSMTQAPNGLCDWSKNFILAGASYSQIDVGCQNIQGNATNCESHGRKKEWYSTWDGGTAREYDGSGANVIDALYVCKQYGENNGHTNGFFYQQQTNGHMICGFYDSPVTSAQMDNATSHGHNMGTICNLDVATTVSVTTGQYANTSLDCVEVWIEPFIRLCLQYVTLDNVNGLHDAIRLATSNVSKSCVFQTSGKFDPLLTLYQSMSCNTLTLSPETKVDRSTGCGSV